MRPVLLCAALASSVASISGAPLQPRMTILVEPAPNAAGWNNSAVTVVFSCVDVDPCPPPSTLNSQGSSLRVSRLSFATDGKTIEAATTVNVDWTAPAVRITSLPVQSTTYETRVTISALAVDDVAGLASARCNGRPAALAGSTISCEMALKPGDNDIIVTATDRADNTASAFVRILRLATQPTPQLDTTVLALRVGEAAELHVVDQAAQNIEDIVVTSSDPTVVQVPVQSRAVVRALRTGSAEVTVTVGGASSSAAVTVFEGRIPMGTTVWKGAPRIHNHGISKVVQVEPHAAGAVLLSVENGETGGTVIRAVTRPPGRLLWVEWAAIAEDERLVEYMMDNSGGALLLLHRSAGQGSAVVRIGRPDRGRLWRYESSGRLHVEFAMGWDGTLYLVETPADGFARIVALDSETGHTRWRVPVPRRSPGEGVNDCDAARAPQPAAPVVSTPTLPDGDVAVVSFVADIACPASQDSARRALNQLWLWPDGTSSATRIAVVPAPATELHTYKVVPDGNGGRLSALRQRVGGRVTYRVIRTIGERRTEYELPVYGEYVLGDDWAYVCDGQTLVAFNPVNGAVAWSFRPGWAMSILVAVKNGGVAVRNYEGVRKVEGNGTLGILYVSGGSDLQQLRPPRD